MASREIAVIHIGSIPIDQMLLLEKLEAHHIMIRADVVLEEDSKRVLEARSASRQKLHLNTFPCTKSLTNDTTRTLVYV